MFAVCCKFFSFVADFSKKKSTQVFVVINTLPSDQI